MGTRRIESQVYPSEQGEEKVVMCQTGRTGITPASNKVADPLYGSLGELPSGVSGHID